MFVNIDNIDGYRFLSILCKHVHMSFTDLPGHTNDADRCAPIGSESLNADTAETLARTLRVISDPTRLRLISMVAAQADSESCVCDLTEPLGLSQPTVSHHLKILVEAGIFSREKRGTWAYYELVPGALDSIANRIATV